MERRRRTVRAPLVVLSLLVGAAAIAAPPADLIAHRGAPHQAEDWSVLPFADQGAWFGFTLPPSGSHDGGSSGSGFNGPFVHAMGRWAGPSLARLLVGDPSHGDASADDIVFTEWESVALPGLLRRSLTADGLRLDLELWFDSTSTAFVRARIRSTESRRLALAWSGHVFEDQATLTADGGRVVARSVPDAERSAGSANGWRLRVDSNRPTTATLDRNTYRLDLGSVELTAETPIETVLALRLDIDAGDRGSAPPAAAAAPDPATARASFAANRERWQRWVAAVDPGSGATMPTRIVAIKALQTLVANWRGPAGRFRHDGLFPSSNIWYFNGFWAWDSWKHAVGTLVFDPELAKRQVRAMFDHQNDAGMIADVVYLDPSEDNWRDTKPPLAGWAIEAIVEATGDHDFARELYPKLVAYHRFWSAERDHDGDGLSEYGSTDGTVVAARWESGMDNAVRFDDVAMLRNGETAWSMDRESVDLNSYLYREKLALATLADTLGREDEAVRWRRDAEALGERIREAMFDVESGWFYDIAIDSGAFIEVQGPEGWTPLWTGVATAEQAAAARRTMLDPQVFRTHVPFPTVARDHPEFSDGYWRGLVWIDQVYFAIDGLRRYGFDADADALTRQLFDHLAGATVPGAPLRENYHPLTGEGRNANHFSWTAAHLLLLVDARSPHG